MSPDLQVLADNRDALLLAEVAAWLHDWQKCIDMAVASHWKRGQIVNQTKIQEWQQRGQQWRPGDFSTTLAANIVSICNETVDFKSLIETGREPSRALASTGLLTRNLGRSHSAAHIEKELRDDESRHLSTDWSSTPWGYEEKQPQGFIQNLITSVKPAFDKLVKDTGRYRDFLATLKRIFAHAWGDTRYPVNEVTLWDWSSIVAALYKAELARCVVSGEQRLPNEIAWRLLSLRTDGLDYLFGVSSIPDLLARRDLLTDGWNRVQKLLEETYPLGLEVYRDENGPVFVVPDIQDLGTLQDSVSGKTLQQQILEQFAQGTVRRDPKLAIQGELVPDFHLDIESWKGQPAPQELPPISKNWKDLSRKGHLERDVKTMPHPEYVADWWDSPGAEVCTVCGLRPQGPSQKAKDRHVCEICEQRRADRSKEWALEKLHTTIWIDEVADANGRLALVVGYFDLVHWLSGDLVRTLAVREPNDQNGHTANEVAKNPSFARLRRIWETTRTFWQEVGPTDDDERIATSLIGLSVEQGGPRLEIKGALRPARSEDTTPGAYHTCELILPRGVKLSAVWDEKSQRFITCDNLEYLAGERLLGEPVQNVLRVGSTFTIEEPIGYGASNKEWGTIMLTQDAEGVPNSTYAPVIPILAQPRTFMALVPADKALDVVKAIKAKYETEMGKVRNRLPLHLGVVYAGRRTPLASVLNAGRRMLRYPARTVQAKVKSVSPVDPWANEVTLSLAVDGRQIEVTVPTVMGDGSTHDVWYPYWQVAGKPTGRDHWFAGPDGEHWVHICDLHPTDIVAFTPSTFDFEYLDASARRFEVAYGDDGRRLSQDKKQRPYLLEEVDALEAAWGKISTLSTSQTKALEALIEEKRQAWKEPTGDADRVSEAFRQFVEDALRTAHVYSDEMLHAALTGMLADTLEIHLTIRKDKSRKEDV